MKRNASFFSWLIIVVAVLIGAPASAVRAEMIGTDAVMQNQADEDRAKVESFLERATVKDRLQAMGVDGVVAKSRVASLSDQEVHALAQRIDSLPAGGRFTNQELIIILLVALLLVLIL